MQSLKLLLNFITGHLYEVKCKSRLAPMFYLSPGGVLPCCSPRLDLRKTVKNIDLIKIEFLFSFINNGFEGRCVGEAFGNILSMESLFCGCSKHTHKKLGSQ